jgi:hypothetical protein
MGPEEIRFHSVHSSARRVTRNWRGEFWSISERIRTVFRGKLAKFTQLSNRARQIASASRSGFPGIVGIGCRAAGGELVGKPELVEWVENHDLIEWVENA